MNRFLKAIFLTCFVIGTLYAEDFTTLDGDHYSSATIKRVEPDGLVIAYSDGVKKLKFKNLPTKIGKEYGYNTVVESQYLDQQQPSAAASYQPAIQPPQPANISKNIAASIPSSLIQTSTITPVVPIISDSIKTLFSNVYISIKQSVKAFLLKWLHILFPWAFPENQPSSSTNQPSSSTNQPSSSTNQPSSSTNQPSSSTNQLVDPQQIILQTLNKPVISSDELSSLSYKYPLIIERCLSNRHLKLVGVVTSIFISGIDAEKAEIILENQNIGKIIIIHNLKKYEPLYAGKKAFTEFWQIIGGELFYVKRSIVVGDDSQITKLVCSIGNYLPETIVSFKRHTLNSIIFDTAPNY